MNYKKHESLIFLSQNSCKMLLFQICLVYYLLFVETFYMTIKLSFFWKYLYGHTVSLQRGKPEAEKWWKPKVKKLVQLIFRVFSFSC